MKHIKCNKYVAFSHFHGFNVNNLGLYYFEDFSVKEIADILKISETAVQSRLQRARQKLKEVLGGLEL